MNRTEYIRSRFEKILSENINEKANEILTKLNLDKEVPFDAPGGPSDYVQEGETCEQCGGEMKEGEQCEQCSSKKYTMEEIEEGIKVKSKASLVQEQINESLKWFKKII